MVIAFFDVDETIISIKSMFSFAEFFLSRGDYLPEEEGQARLRALIPASGATPRDALSSREALNRRFYEIVLSGTPTELVRRAGAEWFEWARVSTPAGFFIRSTLNALRQHQADGARVVLVSGSFNAVLDPLARRIEVERTICTQLESHEGVYTGAIEVPSIGVHKLARVLEVLASSGVPAADCFAYGDHESDLSMLDSVGHPVVVGNDPVLCEHARRHGWKILSGAPHSPVRAGCP